MKKQLLNDKKSLSVIITAHNLENEIIRGLQSIHNQVIDNAEFIIIDDGSTDNTKNKIFNYLNDIKDNRFKYVYKEQGGVASARNYGMKIANGEYLMFFDGDDTLINNKQIYSHLISKMNKYNLDILEFNFQRIKNGEKVGEAYALNDDWGPTTGLQILTDLYKSSDKFHPEICKCIYKFSYIKNINLKFENLVAAEDRVWLWQAFLNAQRVMHIHNIYYNYITRNNSFMHTHTDDISQQRVHDNIYGTEKLFNIIKNDSQINEKQLKLFSFYFVKSYISDSIEGCSSGYMINRHKFKTMIKNSRLDIKDKIKSFIVLYLPNAIRKPVSKWFYKKYIQQI